MLCGYVTLIFYILIECWCPGQIFSLGEEKRSWRYRGLGGNEFMAGPRPRLLLTIFIGCFTAARL